MIDHRRFVSAVILTLGLAACTASTPAPPSPPPARATAAAPQTQAAAAPVSRTEVLPLGPASPAIVHRGTGPVLAPTAGAAPPIAVAPGGEVTLNFTDADVREFVRAVVGGVLGLNYFIDPKAQGTVTVQTVNPLPRPAVLPTVERILRADGLTLTNDNGIIRVAPIETGQQSGQQGAGKAQAGPGLGVRVLPLRYVSAEQLQKVLQPFVAEGASLQADDAHNVLLYSGTPEDMDAFADLVRTFDIDWIAHTSFALVPLRTDTAETVVDELKSIIAGGSGDAAGAAESLRIVPVERLNAILVITAQPRYLDWARAQIAALEVGSEDSTERTYIYHVQFGRAADLADVLARIFGVTVSAPSAQGKPPASSALYSQSAAGITTSPLGSQGGGTMPTSGLGTGLTAPTGAPGGGLTSTGSLGLSAPQSGPSPQAPGGTAQSAPGTAAPEAAPLGPAPAAPPTTPQRPVMRIVTDERNNALVIDTTPREYRRVEEALRRLDVKPLQVDIEATIAEVTLTNQLQFGLQWFFREHNSSATFTNLVTGIPTQQFPGFSYIFSEANVQVLLNALSAITTVKVISSPQLLVLNNQTAQLQVGQEVPVPVEQQQSTLTPGAPLINTINYVNTGVILTVTPRANTTGEVTLDIAQEVSDVATLTSGSLNGPTINERRVQSTVSVDSGQAVALGGLIQDSVDKTRTAVPILGDIPVLGALFRSDDNTTTRTELLVLIEPRIIRGTDDALAATQELERRMQNITPIPEM
jgi:general secretion pathway protein D